tara:strand:- start:142 stop:264 length:123 start_codon:yes stop_codon:yes gene_type:complete
MIIDQGKKYAEMADKIQPPKEELYIEKGKLKRRKKLQKDK